MEKTNYLKQFNYSYFVDGEKLSQKTGLSKKALLNRAARGTFPRPAYFNVKAYWLSSEVDEWIEAHKDKVAVYLAKKDGE